MISEDLSHSLENAKSYQGTLVISRRIEHLWHHFNETFAASLDCFCSSHEPRTPDEGRFHPLEPLRLATWMPCRVHSLLSTFRDRCAELVVNRYVTEIGMQRTLGIEVERAYRMSDLLDPCMEMTSAWGRFLHGEAEAKVARLDARANE